MIIRPDTVEISTLPFGALDAYFDKYGVTQANDLPAVCIPFLLKAPSSENNRKIFQNRPTANASLTSKSPGLGNFKKLITPTLLHQSGRTPLTSTTTKGLLAGLRPPMATAVTPVIATVAPLLKGIAAGLGPPWTTRKTALLMKRPLIADTINSNVYRSSNSEFYHLKTQGRWM